MRRLDKVLPPLVLPDDTDAGDHYVHTVDRISNGSDLDHDFPLSESILDPAVVFGVLAHLGLLFAGWKWKSSRNRLHVSSSVLQSVVTTSASCRF